MNKRPRGVDKLSTVGYSRAMNNTNTMFHNTCQAAAAKLAARQVSTMDLPSYPNMSAWQHNYIAHVAANPGCTRADVTRACLCNGDAGHKWVYDGIARLVRQGALRSEPHSTDGRAQALFVIYS